MISAFPKYCGVHEAPVLLFAAVFAQTLLQLVPSFVRYGTRVGLLGVDSAWGVLPTVRFLRLGL